MKGLISMKPDYEAWAKDQPVNSRGEKQKDTTKDYRDSKYWDKVAKEVVEDNTPVDKAWQKILDDLEKRTWVHIPMEGQDS